MDKMFTPQVLAESKPQLGEVGEGGFPFLIATPKMKYWPSKDLGKKTNVYESIVKNSQLLFIF